MAPHNTETENKIFDKISNNDAASVISYFSQHKLKTDIYDKQGMTPLQHAVFKGNKELVQFFLDQGADVNFGKHEHNYSTLHFAALSGKKEICFMILEQGGKINATNDVSRTASQVAAFIGNHSCAAVINNFIPTSDLEYYIKPTGLEAEPKLPPILILPMHKFINEVNLNPVKIVMNVKKYNLQEHLENVKCVLECMRNKEKKKRDTNEVLSFKFHYLSFLVSEITKCERMLESHEKEKKQDPIEFFIKKLLKTNKKGFLDFQDNLLRECVRDFPYKDWEIFHVLAAHLTAGDNPPNALSVIISVINGQTGFIDPGKVTCSTCEEENPTKKCSRCKSVQYCDKECQKLHWFIHKRNCESMNEV